MSDPLTLALALLVGAALGAFFFGGLWWTVQKGLASGTPALWFLGSLVLRIGLTLAGFYFVAHGEWSRFLASLVGFLIARVIVVRWLAPAPTEVQTPLEKETSHAP
jgi:F1F0 ATPase subunit 2